MFDYQELATALINGKAPLVKELTIKALDGGEIPKDVLNNGLVAYYPFNGNANDESGNGNNGNLFQDFFDTQLFPGPLGDQGRTDLPGFGTHLALSKGHQEDGKVRKNQD